jgi:hypothetical protein
MDKKLDIELVFGTRPLLFKRVPPKNNGAQVNTRPTSGLLPRNILHVTGNRQTSAVTDDTLSHGILADGAPNTD